MLSEATKAAFVRYQRSQLLARDYLFHNSSWIYRPLWTYEAERKGSKIIFYFYSTNCEKFKQGSTNPSLAYGWETMTWPKYIVWNENQLNFVRRAVGSDVNINVAGPVPFIASSNINKGVPENFIAVFDVQPMRDSVYQRMGIEFEYYVPKNAIQFLYDIQQATTNIGEIMVLKRKRKVASNLHPAYVRAIDQLGKTSNYMEIDPDISAIEIINKSKAVISAPFTSTANIARDLGKPSAYYDPYAILYKDDPAKHGIPILQGLDELQEWLLNVIQAEEEGRSCEISQDSSDNIFK
jgi:polysaccharide biosynthesis PFTS motif protein